MIYYNITVNVEQQIAHEWLHWVKQEFLGLFLETNCFADVKILKLLNEMEGNTGVTFALQFECLSMGTLNTFLTKHAQHIQKIHYERYKGQHVMFQTLLQEV